MIRRLTIALALLLVATACGSSDADTEPTDVEAYIAEIERIISEFDQENEKIDGLREMPGNDDLLDLALSYMTYEATLAAMEAVAPPGEVALEHERVVVRLADVQAVIGPYLDEAIEIGEINPDDLFNQPSVSSRLDSLAAACLGLDLKLTTLGVERLPEACGLIET